MVEADAVDVGLVGMHIASAASRLEVPNDFAAHGLVEGQDFFLAFAQNEYVLQVRLPAFLQEPLVLGDRSRILGEAVGHQGVEDLPYFYLAVAVFEGSLFESLQTHRDLLFGVRQVVCVLDRSS